MWKCNTHTNKQVCFSKTWQTQGATPLESVLHWQDCEVMSFGVYLFSYVIILIADWGVRRHLAAEVWLMKWLCKNKWTRLCEWILGASQSHNFKFMPINVLLRFATTNNNLSDYADLVCEFLIWAMRCPSVLRPCQIVELCCASVKHTRTHTHTVSVEKTPANECCYQCALLCCSACDDRLWEICCCFGIGNAVCWNW